MDYRELSSLLLPVLLVGGVIVLNRVMHPDHFRVESAKLIDHEVLLNVGYYAVRMVKQLSFEFSGFIPLFLIGVCLLHKAPRAVAGFYLTSLCYVMFVILLIKGAVVHQYYSLPFVASFSIIVTFAVFKMTEMFAGAGAKLVLLLVVLAVFSPRIVNVKKAFANEYPKDILEICDLIKKEKGHQRVLALGKGHMIFKYHFDIPSKYAIYEPDSAKLNLVKSYLNTQDFDYVIISNRLKGVNESLRLERYQVIYKKDFTVYKSIQLPEPLPGRSL